MRGTSSGTNLSVPCMLVRDVPHLDGEGIKFGGRSMLIYVNKLPREVNQYEQCCKRFQKKQTK